MLEEKRQEAITLFGAELVSQVIEVVTMSDPDGAYSLYEDLGHFEHAECVSFLYFED
jgi:hypothetical protein